MNKVVVIGAAGFIGSHLCEALVRRGYLVCGIDDLSRGNLKNLAELSSNSNFHFVEGCADNYELLNLHFKSATSVYHLGDESDIRTALTHPESYFKKNSSSLMSVLLACRDNNIKRLFFPSSTTVFSSHAKAPMNESYGPLLPESLYGASKNLSEAFLKAWSVAYAEMKITVLRFAAIVGSRQDHGVIHDFVKRLSFGANQLHVLGNGKQLRSFVLVDDCVDAVIELMERQQEICYDVVHLANENVISIRDVATIVCKTLEITNAQIVYEDSPLGWVGDSFTNQLDCSKMTSLGIKLKHSTHETVNIAAQRLRIQYSKEV